MKEIFLYTDLRSGRLDYVIDFINEKFTKLKISICREPGHSQIQYITYQAKEDVLSIPYSGILERSAKTLNFVDFERELKITQNHFNFDLFGAIFFLLSRSEEYGHFDPDSHGRFPASQSILFKKGLLKIPVIDIWIERLAKILHNITGTDPGLERKYTFQSTIDVDHMFAYKHKPLTIWLGSFFRDLFKGKFRNLARRFAAIDPFDKFDWMFQLHEELGLDPLMFILCACRSSYDKSLPPENKEFIYRVQSFSDKYEIGIHPSYKAAENEKKLVIEKKLLEAIVGKKITRSRQHFVRLKFPDTYRALLNSGIKEDYSMGFPEMIGFRAGTCSPFYWYDLEKEEPTQLRIYPFSIMDVTLRNYMELDPEKAFEAAKEIIDISKACGGYLSVVWHNSSFYDLEGWSRWDKCYRRILSEAKN